MITGFQEKPPDNDRTPAKTYLILIIIVVVSFVAIYFTAGW